MSSFSLSMPKNVYCGEGATCNIADIVRGKYKKAVLFTAEPLVASGTTKEPMQQLTSAGVSVTVIDDVPAESDYMQAQALIERFYACDADLIVAVGGGSVMDVAKLASIMTKGAYTTKDLLDTPSLGKKQVATIMIPTTAGTGSEATPNSILAVPEKNLKVGIVNTEMIADYVILDGTMLRTLPKSVAAATGVDALCHAIECYTSKKANPFSDLFAMEAMKLIFANIEKACLDPDAAAAKNNMLLAAFYGGVAITASGTTAVHALSYPLGGRYHISHGVSNALLLLPVMKFNKADCQEELAAVYDAVCADPAASGSGEKAQWVLTRIEHILDVLSLPRKLTDFGIGREDLDDLVSAGMDVTRLLVNNKRTVSAADARAIYEEIM